VDFAVPTLLYFVLMQCPSVMLSCLCSLQCKKEECLYDTLDSVESIIWFSFWEILLVLLALGGLLNVNR
jgi:hypothetical protein